ncbi:MAG: helix-turn-helix domain-containing protein [Candidatus Falkowbacteria bacterium]|nr:hypothetical protein [Candidatus Parcubacteria bacterium]
MDYRELVNLGLAEKEAKVYLASLEIGKSVVQKIAQKAEINRATAYVIIEVLMKKGLMSSFVQGKKQYFYAESPEKLNLLFREQVMAIQRKQEYLDKILPELRALKANDKDKPTVRYFEGKAGLIAMTEEFYTTRQNESAKMIYSLDLIKDVFTAEECDQFTKRRIKKGIKTEVIYNSKEGERKSTIDGRRYKIDEKKFPISAEIAIFGNKIRLASLKGKLTGIIVEDKEITKTLKTLFNLALIGIKFLDKRKD